MAFLNTDDLNKVMDALMSRDEAACMVAQAIVTKSKDALSSGALRNAADSKYGSSDIEIDDEAATSIGDDGGWVAAWVYMVNPDCGQCEGTGETESASDGEPEECPVCDGTGTVAWEA